MKRLYPLKFSPIFKEKIWGGDKILKLKKSESAPSSTLIGESWEISGMVDDVTTVANGFLEGNEINDLIEIYMEEIVGEEIYNRYGTEFPLLIKLLEVVEPLSLQIHPDDFTAIERHNSYGKSECWYIVEAEPTARIYLGLNRELNAQQLYDGCQDGSIENYLNVITPKKGDLIHIPPGMIHSAKGGLVLIEIQQLSDITYRLYDWGREWGEKRRELHMDLAIDCLQYDTVAAESLLFFNGECSTVHFNVKLLDGAVKKEHSYNSHLEDSFKLFYNIEGNFTLSYRDGEISLEPFEALLIPATLGAYTLKTDGKALEIESN